MNYFVRDINHWDKYSPERSIYEFEHMGDLFKVDYIKDIISSFKEENATFREFNLFHNNHYTYPYTLLAVGIKTTFGYRVIFEPELPIVKFVGYIKEDMPELKKWVNGQ